MHLSFLLFSIYLCIHVSMYVMFVLVGITMVFSVLHDSRSYCIVLYCTVLYCFFFAVISVLCCAVWYGIVLYMRAYTHVFVNASLSICIICM